MQRVPALHLLTLLVSATLWLAAPASASAEELTSHGNLVFSAERFFGVYFDHESVELTNGLDAKYDTTGISLGWSHPGRGLLMIPRLGIDYFLSRNLTLGGNLGIFNISYDDYSVTAFLLALRIGYALRLGHVVSLWPRAGFTFTSGALDRGNADYYNFGLTVDAPFAFALTEGFAFTLGPVLDFAFLAKHNDRDASEVAFGVMAGLTGWTNL